MFIYKWYIPVVLFEVFNTGKFIWIYIDLNHTTVENDLYIFLISYLHPSIASVNVLLYIQRVNINFLSNQPPSPNKKKEKKKLKETLDLLLTCLSVSDPNRARLLSFQSYCFCLIILNKIVHVWKSLVYRPLYIQVSDFWEIPFWNTVLFARICWRIHAHVSS